MTQYEIELEDKVSRLERKLRDKENEISDLERLVDQHKSQNSCDHDTIMQLEYEVNQLQGDLRIEHNLRQDY